LFSQYDAKLIGLLLNFVPCGVPYFDRWTNCIGWYVTVISKYGYFEANGPLNFDIWRFGYIAASHSSRWYYCYCFCKVLKFTEII